MTLIVQKLWKLALSNVTLSGIELHLCSPAVSHDLIQIPLVFKGIVQAQGFVLIMLLHSPIITAVAIPKSQDGEIGKNVNLIN